MGGADVSPIDVVLLGGLGIAAFTDVRSGRIPNVLTFPMMLLGIVMHATLGGDAAFGLLGCGLAFLMHYPLWMLGVQKAGDAKLFMGVGACVGWREVVESTIWYAIVYAPVALLVLLVLGQLPNLWRTLRHLADKARGRPVGEAPPPTMLRVGPVILVAGLLARFTDALAGLV